MADRSQMLKVAAAVLVAVVGVGAAGWSAFGNRRPAPGTAANGDPMLPMGGVGGMTTKTLDAKDLPSDPEERKKAIAKQLGVDPSQVVLREGEGGMVIGGPPTLMEGPFAFEAATAEGLWDRLSQKAKAEALKLGSGGGEAVDAAGGALAAAMTGSGPGSDQRPALVIAAVLKDAEVDVDRAVVKRVTGRGERGQGMQMKIATQLMRDASVLEKPRYAVTVPVKLKDSKAPDGSTTVTAEVVQGPSGGWELLSYDLATSDSATGAAIGQMLQAARAEQVKAGGGGK